MNNPKDALNCSKCLETVKNPWLCSLSTRLCCFDCIPHGHVGQMIKFRWMDDLTSFVEKIKEDEEILDGARNDLIQDRELFECEKDSFLMDKSKMEEMVEKATQQKEILQVEKNIVDEERQTVAKTLETLTQERECIAVDRQILQSELNELIKEKEKIIANKEKIKDEREKLIHERMALRQTATSAEGKIQRNTKGKPRRKRRRRN